MTTEGTHADGSLKLSYFVENSAGDDDVGYAQNHVRRAAHGQDETGQERHL